MNLLQKLVEVRKSVPYFKKDTQGHGYNYVSGSSILGVIREKMDNMGLLLIPNLSSVKNEEIVYKTKNGDKQYWQASGELTYTWIDAESGEKLEINWSFIGQQDDSSKALGSGLTYSERYFLLKFFSIPTDKDDPDAFSKSIDNLSGNEELNGLRESCQNGVNALISKGLLPTTVREIVFDKIGMSIQDCEDNKKLQKLIDFLRTKYKSIKIDKFEEPEKPIINTDIDLTTVLDEIALRKFGSAEERKLILDSAMKATNDHDLNVIHLQILSRPLIVQESPEVEQPKEEPVDASNIEDLQNRILKGLLVLEENHIDKFDTATRRKNSMKQHLGVDNPRECNDTDKLSVYVEVLKKKYTEWKETK
jgi:hypothetical protein